MSLRELCRLCLRKPTEKAYTPEEKLRRLILKYLGIEMKEGEDMETPDIVCSSCLLRLRDFHHLYLESRKNQHKLETLKIAILEEQEKAEEEEILEEEELKVEILDEAFEEEQPENSIEDSQEEVPEPLAEESVETSDNAPPRRGSRGPKKRIDTEVVCPECGDLVKSNRLKTHLQRYHEGFEGRCEQCDKTFTDRIRYQQHKNYHNRSIPCVCPECGKVFQNEKSLRNHSRSHLPKVECDECGKQLVSEKKLKVHKKKVHTPNAERPHKCSHCDRGFWDREDLIDHEAAHTGQYQRDCMFCAKQMRNMPNLYVHLKTQHPIQYAAYQQKKEEQRIAKISAALAAQAAK